MSARHAARAAMPGDGGDCDAILGLGSNMGDKSANVERAIALLTECGDLRIVARSRLWRTPPWGDTDQDWFVNACLGVETQLGARALLARCHEVEDRMGRVRTRHWGPRVVDVDVLTYGDAVICEPDLVVPHPRIAERAFVLAPLADIAPDLLVDGQTVAEHLRRIDTTGVTPLCD